MILNKFIEMCAHHEAYTGRPPETATMTRRDYDELITSLPAGTIPHVVKFNGQGVVAELNGVSLVVMKERP